MVFSWFLLFFKVVSWFFSSRCKRSTLTVMASTSDSLPLVGSYTSKHLLLDVFTKLKIFRYWRIDRWFKVSFSLFALKVLGLSVTPPGCQRRGDFRCYQRSPLLLTARCLRKKSGSPSGLACSMQPFWPWPIFAGWLGPMQFWSENHQVGWHAAEYLIGD